MTDNAIAGWIWWLCRNDPSRLREFIACLAAYRRLAGEANG